MTSETEYLTVAFEIDVNGETKRPEMDGLSILPRVGESIECNHVHGTKVFFEVSEIHHHFSSIANNILQQITVRGTAV